MITKRWKLFTLDILKKIAWPESLRAETLIKRIEEIKCFDHRERCPSSFLFMSEDSWKKSFASDPHKFQFATLASLEIIHKIYFTSSCFVSRKNDNKKDENFHKTAEILCAPWRCIRLGSWKFFLVKVLRNVLLTLIETLENSINCNFSCSSKRNKKI